MCAPGEVATLGAMGMFEMLQPETIGISMLNGQSWPQSALVLKICPSPDSNRHGIASEGF